MIGRSSEVFLIKVVLLDASDLSEILSFLGIKSVLSFYLTDDMKYVFFDEVQYAENWEL